MSLSLSLRRSCGCSLGRIVILYVMSMALLADVLFGVVGVD